MYVLYDEVERRMVNKIVLRFNLNVGMICNGDIDFGRYVLCYGCSGSGGISIECTIYYGGRYYFYGGGVSGYYYLDKSEYVSGRILVGNNYYFHCGKEVR